MHEFSICQTIVDTVKQKLEKSNPLPERLLKTSIVVGELRQIVPDYLEFAYGVLIKDTLLEGSHLEIEIKPVLGACEVCGWQGHLQKDAIICQRCQATQVELISGKELHIQSIEVEDNE